MKEQAVKSFLFARKTMLACLLIFLASFTLRFAIINNYHVQQFNRFIDLCIYMDGGQLVAEGINPYDYHDGEAKRQEYRSDPYAYCPYVARDQKSWDYFASSNPPLTLLLFGLIHKISPLPISFRLVFSLLDSFLAVVVFLFIKSLWAPLPSRYLFPISLSLAAFSPILLHWGTLLAEDKGIQILLMLLAIYAGNSPSSWSKRWLSPVMLGCSIAFKGIGIFIAPLCLFRALRSSGPSWFKNALRFILVTALSTLIPFIPFTPSVFTRMVERFSQNVAAETAIHASIWRLFAVLNPHHWLLLKSVFIFLFVGLTLFGLLRRCISLEIVTANLLLLFLVILLTTGSIDRMHMAILPSILLMGSIRLDYGKVLSLYYFLGGALTIALLPFCGLFSVYLSSTLHFSGLDYSSYMEYLDGLFALGFMALYSLMLIRLVFRVKSPETVLSSAGIA